MRCAGAGPIFWQASKKIEAGVDDGSKIRKSSQIGDTGYIRVVRNIVKIARLSCLAHQRWIMQPLLTMKLKDRSGKCQKS